MIERSLCATAVLFCCALVAGVVHAQDGGVDGGDGGIGSIDGGESESSPLAMAGHIMVEVSPTAVRLTEVYVLVVEAPIEGPEEGPWLALPEDAVSVQVERGDEFLQPAEGGLVLQNVPEPGRQAVAFSYVVPAEEGRATMAHRLPFSVGTLNVMWPAGAPYSAQAMGFTSRGAVQMGPRPMHVLEREGFGAGERLVIVTSMQTSQEHVQGQAHEAEVETSDPLGSLQIVTLVIALLLLLAGFVLPLTGRWPKASP